MRKILIVGDSWGVGEWVAAPDHPDAIQPGHPGMTQYLSDEFDVQNISRGKASNWQISYALTNYLKFGQWTESPTIFVLQSDAARDTMSIKFDVDYDGIMMKSGSLSEYYTRLLEVWYIKLQMYADLYKVKFHMIGGLSDLDLETLSLYNNLIPCCESWTKLLDPAHVPSKIPLIFMGSKLLEQAKKNKRFDLIEEIVDISDRNFLMAQTLLESDFFGPVYGDYHPSRQGHKVMADYIKNYMEGLQ